MLNIVYIYRIIQCVYYSRKLLSVSEHFKEDRRKYSWKDCQTDDTIRTYRVKLFPSLNNSSTNFCCLVRYYRILSSLALDVCIFAKCEYVSKIAKTNLRSFATFAKQYLVKGIHNVFADDCLLYRKITDVSNPIAFQSDLDHLCIWANTW